MVSVNGVSAYLAADLESRIAKITGNGVMNVVLNVKDELFGLAEELETYSGAVRLGSVQPVPSTSGNGIVERKRTVLGVKSSLLGPSSACRVQPP